MPCQQYSSIGDGTYQDFQTVEHEKTYHYDHGPNPLQSALGYGGAFLLTGGGYSYNAPSGGINYGLNFISGGAWNSVNSSLAGGTFFQDLGQAGRGAWQQMMGAFEKLGNLLGGGSSK